MAHLVLYDGVCGLCNWAVRIILKRDRDARFRFASIQGEFGQTVLAKYGYAFDTLDSFVLLIDHDQPSERFIKKSEAALFVVRELGGWWRFLRVFRLLPRSASDWLYGIIARHRYQWFGRYDSCPIPENRYRDRFPGT